MKPFPFILEKVSFKNKFSLPIHLSSLHPTPLIRTIRIDEQGIFSIDFTIKERSLAVAPVIEEHFAPSIHLSVFPLPIVVSFPRFEIVDRQQNPSLCLWIRNGFYLTVYLTCAQLLLKRLLHNRIKFGMLLSSESDMMRRLMLPIFLIKKIPTLRLLMASSSYIITISLSSLCWYNAYSEQQLFPIFQISIIKSIKRNQQQK